MSQMYVNRLFECVSEMSKRWSFCKIGCIRFWSPGGDAFQVSSCSTDFDFQIYTYWHENLAFLDKLGWGYPSRWVKNINNAKLWP